MLRVMFFLVLLAGSPVAVVAQDSAVKARPVHQSPVPAMRRAASSFLDSLSPELRKQAQFPLAHPERRLWSNLPASMFERKGVSFGEMSAGQAVLAHDLLRSTLSSRGYLKTTGIMYLDEVLKNLASAQSPQRDFSNMFGQGLYWIGIFGDPMKDRSWAWQLDGHHLALNITVVGEVVSITPAFMGSDPAEVREGAYAGWMVQEAEDEKGLLLYASLDSAQRKMALIADTAPVDVITGPGRGDQLKAPTGLPVSRLNDSQGFLFKQLLREYVHNYEDAIAHAQLQRIRRAGIDNIYFAWAGVGEGEPYYYRIHGPGILIEFDNSYAPGSDAGPINHIHTVFREPGNDYGEDLLKLHLEESPHHQAPAI
jgi:hypothetical protein